ncbi:MAG: redoxin domain-containing protein [Granulosicoccaceae bacterium]|jgi:thiol-disulfide isomerase/thioredoxin
MTCSAQLYAATADTLEVNIADQVLTIDRYSAQGEYLLIWVAPGSGSHARVFNAAEELARRGIEVWHVDLVESLFLTGGTSTMRSFDGRYVAGLIDTAHDRTGKRVVLLSRAYGVLPLLKGARRWQINHEQDGADYLAGAILFSPEMYRSIPALGLRPEYEPIAGATNIPLMIYQGGSRGNRWQFPELLQKLQAGQAVVFVKIMHGVTGLYYEGDMAPATLRMLERVPAEIPAVVRLLDKVPTPKQASPMSEVAGAPATRGLDIQLKPYKGKPVPLVLDLYTAEGEQVTRRDYRGKVTVVNFWASWCPPCVEEIPSLNRLRDKMQGEAFELISVNYAEDEQVIRQFLQHVNVDFPVLLDTDGKVSARWNVFAFPSTFVIGPDGRIHYGVNAAIHWDSPEVIATIKGLLR